MGLTFNYDIMQMTNTLDAHRLQKWASELGLGDTLAERFMRAYFTEGKNLSDHAVLVDLARSVGLNAKEASNIVSTGAYLDKVLFDQTEAKQLGVQGVPFFVINRTYGVSGAQDTDYFLQALNQIWAENKPTQTSKESSTEYCEGDYCVR